MIQPICNLGGCIARQSLISNELPQLLKRHSYQRFPSFHISHKFNKSDVIPIKLWYICKKYTGKLSDLRTIKNNSEMAKESIESNGNGAVRNPEKLKALQATLDKIEKDFGKGTIMKMGDQPAFEVSTIATGSIALDHALGIGGYPRGRVIEIYGPESSGKTTLAIHAIAQAQKQGGIAAIIDAEHAFDRTYARNLGVDCDTLLISQPDNG